MTLTNRMFSPGTNALQCHGACHDFDRSFFLKSSFVYVVSHIPPPLYIIALWKIIVLEKIVAGRVGAGPCHDIGFAFLNWSVGF